MPTIPRRCSSQEGVVGFPDAVRDKAELGRRVAREERMPAEAERECTHIGVADRERERQQRTVRLLRQREGLSRAKCERPVESRLPVGNMIERNTCVRRVLCFERPRALPADAVDRMRVVAELRAAVLTRAKRQRPCACG